MIYSLMLSSMLSIVNAGAAEAPSSVGPRPTSATATTPLKRSVEAARALGDAPALGAVVVRCGAPIQTATSGVTRIGGSEPISKDAKFNIGSNSKSVLATLAATYVEEGLLRWDTTISDVLGSSFPNMNAAMGQATLADLLSHRSGLAAYNTGRELSSVVAEGNTASEQRLSFARQVLNSAPTYDRGSQVLYSNAGYVVVGVMLERVGRAPFESLLSQRVFKPLGMDAAVGTPVSPPRGHPWGHFSRSGVHQTYSDPEPVIPAFLQPAGDVSLSLRAYGQYLREHLCGLQNRPTRLLDSDTIQKLHSPHGADGPGLGWGRSEVDGVPASTHVGGTGSFTAYVTVVPSRNVAVATITNSGAESATRPARDLMRALVQSK